MHTALRVCSQCKTYVVTACLVLPPAGLGATCNGGDRLCVLHCMPSQAQLNKHCQASVFFMQPRVAGGRVLFAYTDVHSKGLAAGAVVPEAFASCLGKLHRCYLHQRHLTLALQP